MPKPSKKLVFAKDKSTGKLKLLFKNGHLEITLGKNGAAYELTTDEAMRLAVWLSAWSLREATKK